MSKNNGVRIEAQGLNESRLERIRDALCDAWDIEEDEIHFTQGQRYFSSMRAVTACLPDATESESEFAERMAGIVWKANGRRCPIRISMGDGANVRTFCKYDISRRMRCEK